MYELGDRRASYSVTAAATDLGELADGAPVRTCDSSVYGQLGKGWRDRATTVGPIAFIDLPAWATAPAWSFAPNDGPLTFLKTLAIVRNGTAVTLTVPARYQPVLGLAYERTGFKARAIAEAPSSVTLQACDPGQSPFGMRRRATQVNVGFLVTSMLCASIKVSVPGELSRVVPLSFGMGDCGR